MNMRIPLILAVLLAFGVAGWLSVSPAYPEPIWGLLCNNEASAEAMALAFEEGGKRAEDGTADEQIAARRCILFDADNALDLYVVSERKIGKKKVIALSRERGGAPSFWGIAVVPQQLRGSI